MSDTKSFRVTDPEIWQKFTGKIKSEGRTIESVFNDFIKAQVKTESETTPSFERDQLAEYILANYNLENILKNKKIHLNLESHYDFFEKTGHNAKISLQTAVTKAVQEFYLHKLAQNKKIALDSLEYKQLQVKENFSGRWAVFDSLCNSINISYSAPCIKLKTISDFSTHDLGKILQTDVVIIGTSAKKFDPLQQKYVQRIIIQELEGNAKNNTPQTLKATLYGDYSLGSGQRVRVLGRYRLESVKKENTALPLTFDIFDVLPIEGESRYVITQRELEIAAEYAHAEPEQYLQNIINSFAPHIHGRDHEKLAIILACLGGAKIGENRAESHLLLIGEADTGKSELLRFLPKLFSKCSVIDGSNSTGQSLGFALDEMDGTKVLRAGALIQCNKGILAIDEYDKMQKSEQKKLNRAMEQQTVKYDKAGHDAIAETKTTIIAACNPTNERWHEDREIIENFPFDPSTLTRFDNVVRLSYTLAEMQTRAKIKHIFQHMNEKPQVLDARYLGALLEHLKKQTPKFTTEAQKNLEEFFVNLRNLEQKEGALLIETRQLLGLVRLSMAYAKLLFSPVVDVEILDRTITFYKKSLETLGMATSVQMQIDLRNNSINKDEFFRETFLALAKQNEDGIVNVSELVDKLLENTKFFKAERAVIAYIENSKNSGWLYEPRVGRLKRC